MPYRETYRIVRALTFVLLILGAASAFGSMQEQRPRRAKRGDMEGLMEAYVISKLQESLDLTDQQFAEMVVAQKKLSGHRRDYRQERSRTLQELRQLLGQSEVPVDEITPMLTRLG